MSTLQPLPPKKEVALALLERSSVHFHLDPRAAGVVVPPWFKKQAQLVLQIGLNMPVPIPDLRLDDDGMSCTLSFNRSPFFCVIPWASVFAMIGDDGRAMVWPDDVPPELARQMSGAEAERAQARAGDRKEPARRPMLSEVRMEAPRSEPADANGARPTKESTGTRGAKGAPASSPEPKGKRGKKKTPPPTEVAAEAAPASAEPPAAEVAPAKVEQAPADSPRAAVRDAAAGGKKKRELPPYLRVVK